MVVMDVEAETVRVWFQCPYGHEDVSNQSCAAPSFWRRLKSFNALTGMRMFPMDAINLGKGAALIVPFQCPYGHEDVSNRRSRMGPE